MSKSIYEEALRVKDNPYRTTFEDNGATKVLQEAIEKAQKYDELTTPKKVIVDDSEYESYGRDDYYCPSCNGWLWPEVVREKYCCCCGQALDWSDEFNEQ
jgi:tRNA uridine 5-carbamoylmethylation protein Kti12